MVLRALGSPPVHARPAAARAAGVDLDLTVDLAYTLHAFGGFKYLTSTLGADPAYETEPFTSHWMQIQFE